MTSGVAHAYICLTFSLGILNYYFMMLLPCPLNGAASQPPRISVLLACISTIKVIIKEGILKNRTRIPITSYNKIKIPLIFRKPLFHIFISGKNTSFNPKNWRSHCNTFYHLLDVACENQPRSDRKQRQSVCTSGVQ